MEFRILGTLEAWEDGRPIELAGGRQRMLLALLLLHANEVVSTDRLIDGLWGARQPAMAPKVLQNAISQLRRALGDNLIVTRAPGYMLRVQPEAIDARRFESLLEDGRRSLAAGQPAEAAEILRDALGLWRGRPLDEFVYEPFAEAEIARLEELRLRAREERIEAELGLGRHADLVGELERLVGEQPLRERPRGQLMVALYRSGRQAEALQTYRDGRRLLAEELGLEPGAALRRLEKQLLTQDAALEPPPVVPPPKEQRRRGPTALPSPRRPRRLLLFALVAIAIAAAALPAVFVLTRRGESTPTVFPNALVKIDPESHEVVDVFRVGGEPEKPAVVGDYVFVSSGEDDILSRVDVRSGEVDTFGGLPSPPGGLAAGAHGTLWVGSGEGNQVRQIDAVSYQLLQVLELPDGSGPWALAVGGSSVWVSHNDPAAVSRFSARTGAFLHRFQHSPGGFVYSAEVAFGEGAAWTAANGSDGELLRVEALGDGSERIAVGQIPFAVGLGFGAVWVSDLVEPPAVNAEPETGQVLRVDPATGKLEDLIPVGKRPSGVATGGGSVWVANGGETTVSQIDPRTNTVVSTIPTRYYAHAVAYAHGHLWVSLHAEPFAF